MKSQVSTFPSNANFGLDIAFQDLAPDISQFKPRSFHAQECLNRGVSLHVQGRVHEALREYQNALDVDGHDPYGRYLAGLALKAIGSDGEAKSEWQRAGDLRVLDEDSAWGLAMARKLLDSDL